LVSGKGDENAVNGVSYLLVFPNTHDRPADLLETARIGAIAFGVPFQLLRPILCVWTPRNMTVVGTTMPETAVNKDGDSFLCKNDVSTRNPISTAYPEVLPVSQSAGEER
jgi:hypothetical protein